jgi:hypothetical protein
MKVSLEQNWRLYQPIKPKGYKIIGVVTDDRGQTGALGITGVGVYVRLNAGVLASLDQEKVARLLN